MHDSWIHRQIKNSANILKSPILSKITKFIDRQYFQVYSIQLAIVQCYNQSSITTLSNTIYRIVENFRVSVQNENFADKTFAFRYKTRILRRKLLRIAPVQLLCRCGPRARVTHPHTRNVRIADCKISWRKLSRMVLKPRKTRKFSPFKVFRYTVVHSYTLVASHYVD